MKLKNRKCLVPVDTRLEKRSQRQHFCPLRASSTLVRSLAGTVLVSPLSEFRECFQKWKSKWIYAEFVSKICENSIEFPKSKKYSLLGNSQFIFSRHSLLGLAALLHRESVEHVVHGGLRDRVLRDRKRVLPCLDGFELLRERHVVSGHLQCDSTMKVNLNSMIPLKLNRPKFSRYVG